MSRGYKTEFREAAAVAVAAATAKMPNFIKLPHYLLLRRLRRCDGKERIQFNCAAGQVEFLCCT